MKIIDRRKALGLGLGATSLGLTTAASALAPEAAVAPIPAAGPMRAVVTLGGRSYEFRQDQGVDLGDFVSEIGGFTQACIRCDVAGLPLTVYFRPDRDSARLEAVFELGRCFNATPANLGAYTVSIWSGDQPQADISVPAHYWFSRWRWQSAPRPVVGDVDALIASGLLPPYHRSTAPANVSSAQSYAIMGLAGVEAYMPQTGERPDIGLVTEPQAQFICTGDANALATLRAQAEAAGTVPWHVRDENTGAPFNFQTYPTASWYGSSSDNPPILGAATPVTIDSAHQPALAYVPYMLTGDPYHLEDLQFQATWNWGSLPPGYRPGIAQSRAFAWSMRTLAQCARVTPAAVPQWLLHQGYWAQLLLVHREFLESNFLNSPDVLHAVFRTTCNIYSTRDEGAAAPGGCWVDPWQEEFLAAVLGWIIAMGFTDWQTAFDWKIGSTLARTIGSGGWIRAQATPYRMILRASTGAPYAQSWAEAWTLSQTVAGLTYADPNTWVPSDMTYLAYTRGALVFAEKLGHPAGDGVSWATQQLQSRAWNTPYKWRLGSGL